MLLRKDGSAEEMDGFDDQDFDAQNEDVDMPELLANYICAP